MNRSQHLSHFFVFMIFLISSTLFGQEKKPTIKTSPAVKQLIVIKKDVNKEQFNKQYYAIQLYYGNNTAAERILKAFKQNYPDWETELIFETPNYKVRVGRFKDLNTANKKLEEIRKNYPTAFLLQPNNL